MTKTLILVRHAHRDTTRRELDNGLDAKGKEQAKAIRRFFMERFHDDERRTAVWLVSSPKVRCLETLIPLSKALDRPVDTHPDLDEQGPQEPLESLRKRVQLFLREWRSSKAHVTVLCSHGDWLPLALLELGGFGQDFKKGCWLELEFNDGPPALRWYIPSFRLFYSPK